MADRAAAAVLSGLGSEGDEGDDARLQCEEALPADEAVAGRTDAAAGSSPIMPSPQAKPQHLGWKVQSPFSPTFKSCSEHLGNRLVLQYCVQACTFTYAMHTEKFGI